MRLKKINKLQDGKLLFAYWANNRGRGKNNCTLQIVDAGTERKNFSRDNKPYIETRTSSWTGNVNLSARVLAALNIKKTDIILEV